MGIIIKTPGPTDPTPPPPPPDGAVAPLDEATEAAQSDDEPAA